MAMLPPLADTQDLSDWLGEDVTGDARAEAVLRQASSLVRAYCKQDFEDADGVPDPVAQVTVTVAARTWGTQPGAPSMLQQTAGLFSQMQQYQGDRGAYLTKWEKQILDAYRKASGLPRGLGVVSTTRWA